MEQGSFITAPGRRNGYSAVRLLDVEPELGAGLSVHARDQARAMLLAPGLDITRGQWTPPEALGRALGVVMVRGILVRVSAWFARPSVHLHGPGDLFDARTTSADGTTWRAIEPVRLAVIDARFMVAARRWPQLMRTLAERQFEGQREQELLGAITTMPRVEERLLALMSRLTSRWGCVTPAGLTLNLPVTHELLGRIVGARRPTVSLAIATLREHGLLERLEDGRWLLPAECLDWAENGIPDGRALRPV